MILNSELVGAILRDHTLKRYLLSENGISEADYRRFDKLGDEKKDIASENILNTLMAFAPFMIFYPSPIEQYPDDVQVYGTRGAYLVTTTRCGRVFQK